MVYYSHSKQIYDTIREKEELNFLESIFPNSVICLNRDLKQLSTNDEFQHWIKKCNVVFVSEVDGYLSSGCKSECRFAKREGIVVFLLQKVNDSYSFIVVKDVLGVSGKGLKRSAKLVLHDH